MIVQQTGNQLQQTGNQLQNRKSITDAQNEDWEIQTKGHFVLDKESDCNPVQYKNILFVVYLKALSYVLLQKVFFS